MRKIAALLLVVIIMASCGGGNTEEIPQDLEGKKTYLKAKKAELRALEGIVKKLTKEIEAEDPSVKSDKHTLVSVSPITRKNFTQYIEIQGSVEAENTVKVSSETGGRLLMFNLKEGDYVKKGQLVAKIDMESVTKQIAELETRLSLAKDLYARQKGLWDQKIGAEVQYLQAKNNVESLEKSIETVKFQMTKQNVYSPASGMVNMTFTKSGEFVGPGMPLFDILDLNQIKVVADVPETYLSAIRKGETVKIKIPALAMERSGQVSLIGSAINSANRTFKVEVKMSNADKKLIPNLLISMLIKEYSAANAIVLPDNLIQQEVSGRSFVYVKGTGEGEVKDIAKKVYVEIGKTYEGDTEIKAGLTGSETIIRDGTRGLVENEAIKIVQN